MTRVVLTAGFDRSLNVVALASLLARDGIVVAGVLVVGVANPARLRAYLRQRGFGFVIGSIQRALGRSAAVSNSPLRDFLLQNAITDRSLRKWCARHGVPYLVVASLDDDDAVSFLRGLHADGVIYGGGGIVRSAFIEAAQNRILNAHHGPLPWIRGMNACEWSLLLEKAPSVSVHFIDCGIDTGPLVETIPFQPDPLANIASLREQCTVAGIEGLRRNVHALNNPVPAIDPQCDAHKQVYTLAPALREILSHRLKERLKQSAAE